MSYPYNEYGNRRLYGDEFRHSRHIAFLRSRAQAKFRNEPWDLTIEQYFEIWNDEDTWNNRGRQADNVCLIRTDPKQPWTMSNVKVVTRLAQLRYARELELAQGRYVRRGRPLGSKNSV